MIQLDLQPFRTKLVQDLDEALNARNLGQVDALVREAEESFQLDIANFAQARKAYLNSQFERTVELLELVLRLNPQFVPAYNWKAIALMDAGKYEAAIDCLNQAIENLVLLNYAVFFYNKGIAYKRMGRVTEAKFCFLISIEQDRNYKFGYLALLTAAGESQQWDEMIAFSRKIGEVFSSDVSFINDVVSFLLQYAERVASANQPDVEKLIVVETNRQAENLVKNNPSDPGVLYNYACVRARLGDRIQALEFLKKAIELEPAYLHHAKSDPDFAKIRDTMEFRQLVETDVERQTTRSD